MSRYILTGGSTTTGSAPDDFYISAIGAGLVDAGSFINVIGTAEVTGALHPSPVIDPGRLVDVGLSRSSGLPSLDNVSLNMVRQAGPYNPLPDDIPGGQHTFILPLNFKRN